MAASGYEVACYVHEHGGFRRCDLLRGLPAPSTSEQCCRVVLGDAVDGRGHFSRLLSETEWTRMSVEAAADAGALGLGEAEDDSGPDDSISISSSSTSSRKTSDTESHNIPCDDEI